MIKVFYLKVGYILYSVLIVFFILIKKFYLGFEYFGCYIFF